MPFTVSLQEGKNNLRARHGVFGTRKRKAVLRCEANAIVEVRKLGAVRIAVSPHAARDRYPGEHSGGQMRGKHKRADESCTAVLAVLAEIKTYGALSPPI